MRETEEPPVTEPSARGGFPGHKTGMRPFVIGLVVGLFISATVWTATTHATPRATIVATSALRGSALPTSLHADHKAPMDLLSDSLCLHAGARCTWERTFGGAFTDKAFAVASAADGRVFVAGDTGYLSTQQNDAWVLCLDRSGKVIWDRVFGGPKPDSAWGLVARPDGGVVVSVATSSYGAGSADAWLLGLDQTGAVRWKRTYGGKYWDRPTGLAVTSDGGLLVVGYTTTQSAGYEDYWVLRLDSEGLL